MRKLPPHIITLLEPKGFQITDNALATYQGTIDRNHLQAILRALQVRQKGS